MSDITDYYPVTCVLTNNRHEQKNKHCEQPIYYRDMSHFRKEGFTVELKRLMAEFFDSISFHTIDEPESISKTLLAFLKHVSTSMHH